MNHRNPEVFLELPIIHYWSQHFSRGTFQRSAARRKTLAVAKSFFSYKKLFGLFCDLSIQIANQLRNSRFHQSFYCRPSIRAF